MRVLVIHDNTQDLSVLMENLKSVVGSVDYESDINHAVEHIKHQDYDVVMMTPSEALELPSHIQFLKRAAHKYIYTVLLFDDMSRRDVIESGANDSIGLNAEAQKFVNVVENARLLKALMAQIGDNSEDFPSADGVIAKSAFNQLFLSGINRAGRYSEQSFVLFLSIENYDELYSLGGPYLADYTAAALAKKFSSMRRQSDIVGQIDKGRFALLLQRPSYETEPLEAASRYISTFKDFVVNGDAAGVPAMVKVSLVEIPSGALLFEESVEIS